MNNISEWTTILQADSDPAFILNMDAEPVRQCQRLATLPFEQSLKVVVMSISCMEQEDWQDFQHHIDKQVSPSVYRLWCSVGNSMRHLLPDVWNMLISYSLPQAVICAEENLAEGTPTEQFAFMACLYVYRKKSVTANVLLTYLLQQIEQDTIYLKQTLHFYQRLTLRQRDVAQLAAQGYTNKEIAKKLFISSAVVAEHLTRIYLDFSASLNLQSTKNGIRYRLIHWMTRLYLKYPELIVQDDY